MLWTQQSSDLTGALLCSDRTTEQSYSQRNILFCTFLLAMGIKISHSDDSQVSVKYRTGIILGGNGTYLYKSIV